MKSAPTKSQPPGEELQQYRAMFMFLLVVVTFALLLPPTIALERIAQQHRGTWLALRTERHPLQ